MSYRCRLPCATARRSKEERRQPHFAFPPPPLKGRSLHKHRRRRRRLFLRLLCPGEGAPPSSPCLSRGGGGDGGGDKEAAAVAAPCPHMRTNDRPLSSSHVDGWMGASVASHSSSFSVGECALEKKGGYDANFLSPPPPVRAADSNERREERSLHLKGEEKDRVSCCRTTFLAWGKQLICDAQVPWTSQ